MEKVRVLKMHGRLEVRSAGVRLRYLSTKVGNGGGASTAQHTSIGTYTTVYTKGVLVLAGKVWGVAMGTSVAPNGMAASYDVRGGATYLVGELLCR